MSRTTTTSHLMPAVLALALLAAPPASALMWPVDFDPCQATAPDCAGGDPCTVINAAVGTPINDTIEAIDHGGVPVSWEIVVAPTGCTTIVADQQYDCNGIVIDASTDPATVAGAPTAGGTFTFAVEGDNGSITCTEGFELVISDPYDLVLVLDRSGSMDDDTFIEPPAADRWDALKRAVSHFTDDVASSSCVADSNIGLTFFSTSVLANIGFPATLTPVDPATVKSDVSNEMIAQQPPNGWTALGLGLQDGIAKLTDPARKRVVMVFSDGEQNRDPEVDPDTGTQYLTSGSPSGAIAPGGTGAFKIVTVGIGNPINEYHSALDRLGNNNGGTYLVTATGEDITTAMASATADLLDGCSPQMVATYSGQLAGVVSLAPFDLNRKVSQLAIRISYSRDFEIPSLAQLIAGVRVEKDGTDVTHLFRPSFVGNFTNSFTLRTDFTDPTITAAAVAGPPDGTYTVTMAEPPDFPALDHRAVVFADDQRLDMDWGVTPATPRAGGSFEPRIELSWFGAPVTGATVEALVLEPGDDVGDALARNPLKVDPTGGEDAGSPGEQKFLALLEDADFLAQILPQEQQLTLTDQGDGSYSGTFSPGDVSGIYQVIFQVSADDPASFGRLERLAHKSVFVRPNVLDLAASAMSASVDGSTIVWRIKPVTVDGRFWGPGQARSLRVAGAGVSVTDIADDQFGGYTITLTGDPAAEVTVQLGDDEIYSGPASGFGPESGEPDGLPSWLLWLILLLIVLFILWALKKVFK